MNNSENIQKLKIMLTIEVYVSSKTQLLENEFIAKLSHPKGIMRKQIVYIQHDEFER